MRLQQGGKLAAPALLFFITITIDPLPPQPLRDSLCLPAQRGENVKKKQFPAHQGGLFLVKMAAHASGCYGYLHTRYSVALTLTSLRSPPGGGWGRSAAMVTTVTTMTTMMMRLMVVAMVVMHGKASRSGTDRAGGRCFTVTLSGNKARKQQSHAAKRQKELSGFRSVAGQ